MQSNQADSYVKNITDAQQKLFAYILTLLPRAGEAHEVLSDVNLALWTHRDSYDPSREFWPWACRFAQLQVMAHRKKHRSDRMMFGTELIELLASEGTNATEEFSPQAEQDQFRALDKCLEKLVPQQRDLLKMRYTQALSVKNIAARLGRSVGAVSDSLYRMRAVLGKCIRMQLANREQEEE